MNAVFAHGFAGDGGQPHGRFLIFFLPSTQRDGEEGVAKSQQSHGEIAGHRHALRHPSNEGIDGTGLVFGYLSGI